MSFIRLRSLFENARQSLPKALLSLTLPETCAGCGQAGVWFCDLCAAKLSHAHQRGCYRCGRRGKPQRECHHCQELFPRVLKRVRSGFVYDGPMRNAIMRFKYSGEYQRGYDLGERLAERVSGLLPSRRIDLVVPIPLHKRRYRSRGFNQSAILAKCISTAVSVPTGEPLARERNTSPQVRLTAEERLENLNRAFEVVPEAKSEIQGKSLLLVDDVMTTGATLAAAARELEDAGAAEVYGVTLAREN
jgi:ComF family protein